MAESMKQSGTDRGERHETGEKEPKGAASSDTKSERHEGKVNGVGMGQEDKTGRSNGSKEKGEFNTGRSESVCYSHGRKSHQ